MTRPPKTADEYLDTLLKQGLPQTVGQLRERKAAIWQMRIQFRGWELN